jgi:hypothetical protein
VRGGRLGPVACGAFLRSSRWRLWLPTCCTSVGSSSKFSTARGVAACAASVSTTAAGAAQLAEATVGSRGGRGGLSGLQRQV